MADTSNYIDSCDSERDGYVRTIRHNEPCRPANYLDGAIADVCPFNETDVAYFNATSTGRIISRINNDANLLRSAVSDALTGIVRDSLTVIFLVAVMFQRDWLLAVIAFFVFPLAIYPIVRLGGRIRQISANTQEEFGQLTTLLDETFRGARHVRAYGMENYEIVGPVQR